mgnify:CR=1 FL=1
MVALHIYAKTTDQNEKVETDELHNSQTLLLIGESLNTRV